MLTNLLIALLSSYIALTSSMADTVLHLFTDKQHVANSEIQSNTEPHPLPSQYDTQDSIPRILLDNLRYQSAAVIESQETRAAYTTDPEQALVNIYCTYTTSRSIRTTTGTGFFVNPDGVILTNAHVAQFLLLETLHENGTTECIVRSGNPASAEYRAALLYIPPAWVQEYAHAILADTPIGTGERDYALLYVNASLTNKPMPARFPALAVHTDLINHGVVNSTITAAGYPVNETANLHDIEYELEAVTATSSVSNLYTFGSNYADVIALRGSTVGGHGSSGGPVLNSDNAVIGLITTRGDDALDGQGSLRAITLSYIDRTITEETGFSLERNVSGNLPYRAQLFTETLAPFLSAILSRSL